MKILYGVVGEGMGHAMRSRVVLDHLVEQGHDVEIVASGRAVAFLGKRFAGVTKIHGLHMIYEDNTVRPAKTVFSNVVSGARGVPQNVAAYFDLISKFKPSAVICDFESWSHLYGKAHRLPILSIDNMQIINRTKLPDDITSGHQTEFQIAKTFIKSKLPWCDEYFITTFFKPPIRKKRTRLFPPILRPEILQASRENGAHLLVYSTSETNEPFVRALSRIGVECRIYGVHRDLTHERVEGNLRYQPFSEQAFIRDLASCKGVIASGGFTLMSEAVYLHKPMLAVPVAGQFEQLVNARYLEREGFGKYSASLGDTQTISEFIHHLPAYEQKLATYSQNGNQEILGALDEWLDKAEAGIV